MEDFLKEDIGTGDVTTDSIVPGDHHSKARIIAKADGIIAGHLYAREVFRILDEDIRYDERKRDGESVVQGDVVTFIEGKTRAILTGERLALNFLQRLSGIATLTSRFVTATGNTGAKILDTRKTGPGLRAMEKYAVRMGGGENHRMTLSEMALIKENHIAIAGSITEAVRRIREKNASVLIEVEVKNMGELQEAAVLPVDRIMLDNWDETSMAEAVRCIARRIPLEASGNMTLERVRQVAATGVDFISVGALTHSYSALDLSLLCEEMKLA